MQGLWTRLSLVGRAIAISAVVAVLPAMAVPHAAPQVWLFIMMGPFAGLWMTNTWGQADAQRWAAVCGLAIIAHPRMARAADQHHQHSWSDALGVHGAGAHLQWGVARLQNQALW